MSDGSRPPSVWAMLGLVVAILGWLLTQAGFAPVVGDPAFEISPETRASLRRVGVVLVFIGLAGAAIARLRAPLGVFAAGITLNIATEAGVVAPHHLGTLGVSAALLGALWASRQISGR